VFCYELRNSTQRAPPFEEMTPRHWVRFSRRLDEKYSRVLRIWSFEDIYFHLARNQTGISFVVGL